jgi:soluble lytic murein transglycosylase
MLCAVLAAQGYYSVAQAQDAGQTGDQTALAMPRIQFHGAAGVGIPQPLAPSEAALVRRIFALQDGGSVAEAVRETARLQDDLLLGAILAERYLHANYRPTAAELTAWLARFGDQFEAAAIRSLLERLAPDEARSDAAVTDTDPPGRAARGGAGGSQIRTLFEQNRDAAAVAAAERLLSGTGPADPRFAGGLAAWRLGRLDTAYALFTAAYGSAGTSTMRAASAYWAGHVAQRRLDRGGFAVWMRRAALETGTFYGMIAHRALSPTITCQPGDTIGDADVEALLTTPQGRRAFALHQVGQKYYAEAELRALWVDTGTDGQLDRSIGLIARALGFAELSAEIEQGAAAGRRRLEEVAFERLQPAGGFVVDPSLVYALVRHESNFHASAVSHSGARGLMQIMPRTAYAVAGEAAARLQDPGVNLQIGQRYLLTLSRDDAVNGDLIRLIAGFTQGEGGIRKWLDSVRDDGDPLMFIEAIPSPFVREFVRDALIHSWRYAAMLDLPATSLGDLAAGRYPRLERAAAETPHPCR